MLNVVVALGGIALARGLDLARDKVAIGTATCQQVTDGGLVWRWSLLVFISGFLIVALQIVWYRLIGVLLQSNSYSFSLVLSVFLLGDAAGLLVGARTIDRIADPRRFFFLMQGIATALALAGAWYVYWAIGAGLLPSSFVDRDIVSGRAIDTAVIVFLLLSWCCRRSFIMGFSFPVVQKAVQRDIDRLGQRVGLVQLANIVGNSAGSLVAGLLLLDQLGTAGTLMLLAAIGLAFAVLQIVASPGARWVYPPAILLLLGLVFFPPDHDFWRRLHGVKTGEAIVAEDKTGLSVLKMSDRAGWPSVHPGPNPEPPAVRHRACLPGCDRSADPSRSQARPGDRLRHRRHALRCGPQPGDRAGARDRDREARHRHAAALSRPQRPVRRRKPAA